MTCRNTPDKIWEVLRKEDEIDKISATKYLCSILKDTASLESRACDEDIIQHGVSYLLGCMKDAEIARHKKARRTFEEMGLKADFDDYIAQLSAEHVDWAEKTSKECWEMFKNQTSCTDR